MPCLKNSRAGSGKKIFGREVRRRGEFDPAVEEVLFATAVAER
jgi:hypothetical protein